MKDAEAERRKQRDQVWSEIISSEKAYVHGLEILEKVQKLNFLKNLLFDETIFSSLCPLLLCSIKWILLD